MAPFAGSGAQILRENRGFHRQKPFRQRTPRVTRVGVLFFDRRVHDVVMVFRVSCVKIPESEHLRNPCDSFLLSLFGLPVSK